MNLVQINERLKDLPMQVVQQYANGMNPEVPPYLALGELQRREMSQKQMATAQGAQQGPQPSIKEQVEQKAGLMQLQQMQQQQMAQQMAQPRGPMPASEGTPQPVDQPEVEMAGGGLAAVPMRSDMFEYASGGIIAFAKGGDVEEKYRQESEEMGEGKRTRYSPDVQAYALQKRAADNAGQDAYMKQEQERQLAGNPMMNVQPAKVNEGGAQRYSDAPGMGYANPNILRPTVENVFYDKDGVRRARKKDVSDEDWNKERLERARTEQQPTSQGPGDQFAPRYPQSGLPAVAKAKATPVAGAQPSAPPRPTAQPPVASGLPAALPQGPVQTGAPAAAIIPVSADRAEVEALMREQKRAAPTAQGVISDVNALMPAGMQEEAMKRLLGEQRARADARQAAYEGSKPTGLQDFIRVMGQAGQSKGFSGLAPAYTALQQQRRADDLAMQKQQDELLTAIESRGMAFDKDVFSARTGAMDKAQTLFGQSQKSILEAATAKLGADQGRLDKQTQLKMQQDLKMFELAQEERLKGMDLEQRERDRKTNAANNPAAQAAQFVALKQRARDLRQNGKPAEADKLDAQAADMMAFKSGSGTAGVGMARNAIMERRQEMKDLDTVVKNESGQFSEEEVKFAARRIAELVRANAKDSGNVSSGPVDTENPLLKK